MILRPEVRTASLGQARSLQPVLPGYGQLLGGHDSHASFLSGRWGSAPTTPPMPPPTTSGG